MGSAKPRIRGLNGRRDRARGRPTRAWGGLCCLAAVERFDPNASHNNVRVLPRSDPPTTAEAEAAAPKLFYVCWGPPSNASLGMTGTQPDHEPRVNESVLFSFLRLAFTYE